MNRPLPGAEAQPVLQLDAVDKRFGEVDVIRGVSLDVRAGECLGLIGPNGAGKTTLFNLISGFLAPSGGAVRYLGRDASGLDVAQRARLGLVRTFQKSLLFGSMNVRRNLALAVLARAGTGYRWWRGRAALHEAEARADDWLARSPLAGLGEQPLAALSYGQQRLVDVLVGLAQEPRVLLLDEPTAGLSAGESEQLAALLAEQRGRFAMVLISHDVDIVFRLCERIAVLDLGQLIALDTPARVRRHDAVRAAYLGAQAGDLDLLQAQAA
ncbi:ABC transporter ATP-binding protein [Verticiella sediminum]|uniref:ABC transporter ATP-binding protein n=1 Tax=Verticiella sediminum TaxID=1247510 RepID=A0A556A5Y0_9BURK|nr:ABC transporter ATP-binding protein [Verticiella sediminum]TSH88264.1 ABC transporter ATP-binding protein [Verticiella sediminum]